MEFLGKSISLGGLHMDAHSAEPSKDLLHALELALNSPHMKKSLLHFLGTLSLLYFLKEFYKNEDIKLREEVTTLYHSYGQKFISTMAKTLAGESDTNLHINIHELEKVFQISLQVLYTIHRDLLVSQEPTCLKAFIPLIGREEKTNPEYYIFPSTLHFSEDVLFPKTYTQGTDKGELIKRRRDLISKYTKDLKRAMEILSSQEERLFRLLYNLSFYYLWSLPGALPADKLYYFSYVSLYEVLKVYLSLTLSLFTSYNLKILFSKNNTQDEPTKNANNKEVKVNNLGKCKFIYIKGDVSGIQKFLFNVNNISGTAKRLRGRSIFLTLIDKMVLYKILDQLGYPLSQITFSGGGHFEVLLGYEEGIEEYLNNIAFTIDRELFEAFNGELGLILESESFSIEELINKGYHNLVSTLLYKVGEAKKRKFLNLFNQLGEDDIEKLLNKDITDEKALRLCPACARYYIIEGEETCRWCRAFYELGEHIGDAQFLLLMPPHKDLDLQITVIDFSPLSKIGLSQIAIDLRNLPTSVKVFRLNNTKLFEGDLCKADGFIALEQHLPYRDLPKKMGNFNVVKTFEELALASKGDPKLAYAKGDLDNLGEILRSGLGSLRLWLPFSMLSTYLDLFFSGYLRFLLNSTTYRDQIYTLYAGGDDFFLIGSWDKILRFLNLLNAKFNSYVGSNQKFHFSVGIIITPPNYPVRLACDIVSEGLQKAKEAKPAIFVFGETLSWEAYQKLFTELTNYITELIEEDKLSRTLIYRFYNLLEQHNIYKTTNSPLHYRFYPLFFYFLNRNVADKEVRQKIIKWLLDEEKNYQIREEALVKLKYVLTLTRKR